MKTTISNLKELFGQILEAGHVDRSKRKAHGYDEASGDVDYTDVAAESIEITEDPGVSQSKRLAHGYGLEEPADYDVPGEGLPKKEEDIFALRARNHEPPALKSMNPPPPIDLTDTEDDMEEMCGPDMEEASEDDFGDVRADLEKAPGNYAPLDKPLIMKHPDDDMHFGMVHNPHYDPKKDKSPKGPAHKQESRMPSLASVLLPPKKKSK